MEYSGIWAIPIKEVIAFFEKEQCIANGTGFQYKSCLIMIESLPPKEILKIPQTKIVITGNETDVKEIYQKFFLNFLSAGG